MTDYTDLLARLDAGYTKPISTPPEFAESATAIRQLVSNLTHTVAERDAARAEVKEYRTDELNYRSQVISLKAERDAAFAMSRCECESNEACKNLVALHDEVERLKQERDAALGKVEYWKIIRTEVATWADEEITRLTAERDFQHSVHVTWKVAHAKKCEQITTLKSALLEAKESVDFYLAANDPSEFGCACDPSVDHLCGPCYADKQQYPLRKAIATINAALGSE